MDEKGLSSIGNEICETNEPPALHLRISINSEPQEFALPPVSDFVVSVENLKAHLRSRHLLFDVRYPSYNPKFDPFIKVPTFKFRIPEESKQARVP